jgi:DNA-binding transcriptional LysR family regulator
MDLFDELRAFVATAQTGSFTAAADQLGMSNRLTSKYVAELESRLGTRLFQRTTRKVGLTPAGEDLLARAPALLDEVDDLLSGVAEQSKSFTGTLRISAPVTFGEVYVGGLLGRFGQMHPGLTFDLRLTDRYTDLASEGIDLAFRIGVSDTLSLKARKLGEFRSIAVASPAYLEQNGRPETPDALLDHCCIVDTNRRNPQRWTFWKDGREEVAAISGRFHVNSAHVAMQLASESFGIAYVPRFAVGAALQSGDLVALLDGYDVEHGPISAVYLEGRRLPRKLRALIDFAVEDIRTAEVL